MHKPGQEWASIDFYYPLIVTSAPLFTVDASAPDVEAVEVSWATETREIKSAKIDGQFNIDIVTSKAFAEYLEKRVNAFGSAVAELAANDPQRFITHQDHDYTRQGDDGPPAE